MQPDEILDIFPNHLAIDYRQVNQPSKVNRKKTISLIKIINKIVNNNDFWNLNQSSVTKNGILKMCNRVMIIIITLSGTSHTHMNKQRKKNIVCIKSA